MAKKLKKYQKTTNTKGNEVKTQPGGTYFVFENGRIGRTYGKYGTYESMDTTGYAKGKKTFELMESRPGVKPNKKTISRSEVPTTISRLKEGATRTVKSKKKK